MTQMLSVRRLVAADAMAAGMVLARAFADDPLWCYLLPDPAKRGRALRQTFCATAPWFVRQEQGYGIGQPLEGVAVWQAPQGLTPPVRRAWLALLNRHTLSILGSSTFWLFRRAIPIFLQFDRMHQQYSPKPHYYLSTIGVIPEAQGQGRASRLIQPILAQADAGNYPVYTETMTPSNVPLYEHYGFVCQEAFQVPQTDLRIWSLYRSARSERNQQREGN